MRVKSSIRMTVKGTAMLEIVHSIAPGNLAELMFAPKGNSAKVR